MKGDDLSQLLFCFPLNYAIRNVRQGQEIVNGWTKFTTDLCWWC